ncbi:MAG: hypothetical protein ACXV2C_08895 [Candidatus Bathyarchaeia archaeon]
MHRQDPISGKPSRSEAGRDMVRRYDLTWGSPKSPNEETLS